MKTTSSAAQWLFRAAAFPCLTAWLTVRMWVPLGEILSNGILLALAAVLSLLTLVCLARTGWCFRPVHSWRDAWEPVLFGAAFLLGSLFDISYHMGNADGLLIAQSWFRPFCHVGNGLVFASLVLALVHAAVPLRELSKVDLRSFLCVLVVLNAVTALYVLTSQTVYVWDVAGYWSVARTLAKEPLTYSNLRAILITTLTLDYNHLLAFPISLVMRLFGDSRAVFIFSISNLCTLPALWALLALGRQHSFPGSVLCALFPMLIYTGLVGFVDTAACALALWAWVVYHSDGPAPARGGIAGVLLVGSFLLRRYFFFFAASFGMAALVQKVVFERKNWRDFLALLLSSALCTLVFAWKFLLDRVLGANYNDLYSAYALGLRNDAFLFCRYFGFLFLLLLTLCAIYTLFRRGNRPLVVFSLFQLTACLLAFVSVQSHGQQHLLLYVPGLAALTATFFDGSTIPIRPHIRQGGVALAGLVFANCLLPKTQPASIAEIVQPDLLPSFHFYGVRRPDIDELKRLMDYVDGLSAQEPASAAVLASSFLLNSETLSNLRPSLQLREPDAVTEILYLGNVDKRDAFNWNVAFVDYLIVGDPVQVHLGEENQQVISLLAHDVLESTGPGIHYKALPETFFLQDGVVVRIYRRTSEWTYDDFQSLSVRLITQYPDYAVLYQVPSWINQ